MKPSPTLHETSPSAPAVSAPGTGEVHRRRSSHHHHRSNARKPSAHEREARLKRRQEMRIFLIAAPTLLFLTGGVLWVIAHSNPDPSMRPQRLIGLSNWMLAISFTFGTIALLVDWIRKWLRIQKERRERAAADALTGRRKSSHRRHRHP